MKFIQDMMEKARPLFTKGGKLEKLYPVFEAGETFWFVLPTRTRSGSHVRDRLDIKRLMSVVIVALGPCFLFGIYNVGYQYHRATGQSPDLLDCMLIGARYVLPIVFVSYSVGGIWELLFAVVRKHEINEGFLVTGLLYPLVLPPTMPLWQVAVGISFGVVIGKEVFGGTGMNVFNPALVARAFVFFAYPGQMSGDSVWVQTAGQPVVDAYSGATPLGVVAGDAMPPLEALAQFGQSGLADYSFANMFVGLIPGSIAETSTLMVLLGGAYLIFSGIGSWQIMLSCFAGGAAMGWILNLAAPAADPNSYAHLPFYYHLVMGGFAFGAVFMATDPVSAAQTPKGKWIYGFLIGFFAVLVRVKNANFAEGMMLSILLMNAFAPLIDYFVVQGNIARRKRRALA